MSGLSAAATIPAIITSRNAMICLIFVGSLCLLYPSIISRTPQYPRYTMKVKVVIHEAEEGGYWAEVPALPGCFSQGDTREETSSNIKEAVQAYLLSV